MSVAAGLDLKEAGQAQALDARPAWKDRAAEAITELAARGTSFTSEDVIDAVGLPSEQVGMNRNNAVGAAMTRAARAGVIRRIGYVASSRKSSHGAVIALWIGVRA